jgi:uncharacterized sulfatase
MFPMPDSPPSPHSTSHRDFCNHAGLAAAGVTLTGCSFGQQPPRNLLLIYVDDLNTSLGCYGHPLAKTPNIDALAARGVRFANAFTPYPLCGPARAAALTGCSPERLRMPINEVRWRDHFPRLVTLPQLFRANGVKTVRYGKIFHESVPGTPESDLAKWDDADSWDEAVSPFGLEYTTPGEETLLSGTAGKGTAIHGIVDPGDGAEQRDHVVVDLALKKLRTTPVDERIFLAVGLVRPHVPFVAPRRFWDLYPLENIPEPDLRRGEGVPGAAYFRHGAPQGALSPEEGRKAIQGYLASTSYMDAQVGRLLEGLKESGRAASTTVVFLADHGWHLGEHDMWRKMTLFEPSLRVPMIFAGSGVNGRGETHGVAETLDLYRTLAELFGFQCSTRVEGASLLPRLTDPALDTNRAAHAWVHLPKAEPGRSIRLGNLRYTEWGETGEKKTQLYDLENDPGEYHNLSGNPTFAREETRLRDRLRDRRDSLSRQIRES